MAKGKKKVSDFQEALLSKTKVIGKDKNTENMPEEANDQFQIDHKLIDQFEALAKAENIAVDALINLALQHFINNKDLFFSDKP